MTFPNGTTKAFVIARLGRSPARLSTLHEALRCVKRVHYSDDSMTTSPDKFTCTRCGNCCRGTGYVYVSTDEVDRIAAQLELPTDDFLETYCETHRGHLVLKSQKNQDCIFLEDNLCRVHDVKPDQCRKWPFWRSVVETYSGFRHAKSYCEGLKEFGYRDFVRVAAEEDVHPGH